MFADDSTLVNNDTIVDGSFDFEFECDFVDMVELHSIMSWTSFMAAPVLYADDNVPVYSVLA